MATFRDKEQLYACLQALFNQIEQENPTAVDGVLKSKLCYLLRFSDVNGMMVVDARQRPLTIQYGTAAPKADLHIDTTAVVLHQILSGNLSLTKAVGSKQLKPQGPVWKVMALADLFSHAQRIYPAIAAAHGVG